MEKEQIECKNCHTIFEGNFCCHCGQEAEVERFNLSNLGHEFIHGFFHVDGGLFFTIKELFVRPGVSLRGYIAGRRVQYFNPFTFLVITSLVGGFLYKWSGVPDYINEIRLASSETIRFTVNNFSLRMLLTIPTYVIMCNVFYRSYKYNIAEFLVINTFLISQSMSFLFLWMLVLLIVEPDSLTFVIIYASAFLSLIIYQVIAYYRLFNVGSSALRWLKATTAVLLGLGLSFLLMNLLMKIL